MKKILWGSVGLVFLLAGCQSNTTKKDETNKTPEQKVTMAVNQELSSLDSTLATDTYSITVLNNVMEGLYRLDENNQLVPASAKDVPTVSDDKLTYTINLRDDLEWSNGDKVTADDFVYGWQKAVNPDTGSEYSGLFAGIKNATEIIEGKLPETDLGIKAVDETTIEVTMERPVPYFESLLAFPTFFPQNKAFVEKEGKQYGATNENLIYNGPFVLEDFDGAGTDTEWKLTKNPTYWDKDKVKLDTIVNQVSKEPSTSVRLFEAGELDDVTLSGELAKQYQENEAFTPLPKAGTTYLTFNQSKDFFKNKKARQAVSLVLDRKNITEFILADGSKEPKGLVPNGMSFSPTDKKDFADVSKPMVKTDIEEAKKLWEEAKKETGTKEITFDLLSYDDEVIKKLAEAIQFDIEDKLSGAKVNVNIVPLTAAIEKGRNAEFDLFLFGWGADYPDPSSFMELLTTDSPYNYGKYSNKDFDKLVEKASTTDVTDDEKRWNDYIEAENILTDDAAVSPIFQKAEAKLRNPKLKGIVNHSTGAQFDFKEAYLEE